MKTIALYVVVGFSGIIFVTADGQGDLGCDYRAFLSTCCSDDFDSIHNGTSTKKCSACIGRLCRSECPRGYYGEQCDEICTCGADVCDDVFGCITTEKTSTSVDEKSTDEQKGKPSGMVLKISLSASLFIIIVLLVVLLGVVYRARKNNTGYPTVSTERNASNVSSSEDITRDSPVIYAAVVRPNKKPTRSIEQSDQMYGNMLKLQKPTRGRKKKARTSKFNKSNNAMNEEAVKNGTPATYSFVEPPNKISPLDVRNPDRTLSLDKGHPDRTSSLDVRHHGKTLSSDEGQYDQEYGNMTMC